MSDYEAVRAKAVEAAARALFDNHSEAMGMAIRSSDLTDTGMAMVLDAWGQRVTIALAAADAAMAAAGWVRVPIELLTELADDLEGEITANRRNERVTRRDMEPVYRARAMLAAARTGNEEKLCP